MAEKYSANLNAEALEAMKRRFLGHFQDFEETGGFRGEGSYFSSRRQRPREEALAHAAELTRRKKARETTGELLDILLVPRAFLDGSTAKRFSSFRRTQDKFEDVVSESLFSGAPTPQTVTNFVQQISELYFKAAGSKPYNDLRVVPTTLLALAKPNEAIALSTSAFNRAARQLWGRPILRRAFLTTHEYGEALELANMIARVMWNDWSWSPRTLWDVQGFIVWNHRLLVQEEGERRRERKSVPPPPQEEPSDVDEEAEESEEEDTAAHNELVEQANTHFVPDDAEVERDELGRDVLAIALARRLHRIWCATNDVVLSENPGEETMPRGRLWADGRGAFVVHLDAPWGGGKTTFANLLAGVLNPYRGGTDKAPQFLRRRYGFDSNLGTIFLEDPRPENGRSGDSANDQSSGDDQRSRANGQVSGWPDDARRPWVIVPFNAWQAERCSPPWWVFFQAIRKRSFAAILREGRAAVTAGAAPQRRWTGPVARAARRLARVVPWAWLWGRELWWRFLNPRIITLAGTGAASLILLLILYLSGALSRTAEGGLALTAGNWPGLLLVALTSISWLWGAGALLFDSLLPRPAAAEEHASIGGSDPLERFRSHFAATMEAIRRPIMVIIDDLDRCKPDFIVDLVRGIQTVLRSPRIVYVILGDRDWIERAFEAHHHAMTRIAVGSEQTFGARFVEKAIQMSFILPAVPRKRREAFVQGRLRGQATEKVIRRNELSPALATELRASLKEAVVASVEHFDPAQARKEVMAKFDEQPAARTAAVDRVQAEKFVNEELAISAALDSRVEEKITHRLDDLAGYFPANPRQVKRIINSIAMYYAVALMQEASGAEDPLSPELAIWVIIMTEWPHSWRVLAAYPQLVRPEVLSSSNPKTRLKKLLPHLRAAELDVLCGELRRMKADEHLMGLIRGGEDGAHPLDEDEIRKFAELTPLYSRKHGLLAGAPS